MPETAERLADRLAARRASLERNAPLLLVGSALVMATICAGIIVSGWFAGVLEDHAERFFWSGAILEFLSIAAFAVAAFPGGENDRRAVLRITWLTRIGLVLFLVAPALCIGAMIADFYS
jgi:hypothetical protein